MDFLTLYFSVRGFFYPCFFFESIGLGDGVSLQGKCQRDS